MRGKEKGRYREEGGGRKSCIGREGYKDGRERGNEGERERENEGEGERERKRKEKRGRGEGREGT